MKKNGFWDRYYEAKTLAAKEFYVKRFNILEIIIFSLVAAGIILYVDYIFYYFPNTRETLWNKILFITFILIGFVLLYRYQLLKIRKKK